MTLFARQLHQLCHAAWTYRPSLLADWLCTAHGTKRAAALRLRHPHWRPTETSAASHSIMCQAPLYILSAQRLRSSQQGPRMPSWMCSSAALQAAAAPGADGTSSVAQPCTEMSSGLTWSERSRLYEVAVCLLHHEGKKAKCSCHSWAQQRAVLLAGCARQVTLPLAEPWQPNRARAPSPFWHMAMLSFCRLKFLLCLLVASVAGVVQQHMPARSSAAAHAHQWDGPSC